MLDVFKSDAFTMASLTESINKLPYKPGRLGSLGLFGKRSITSTTAVLEEKDGKLMLVPTSARGTMSTAFSGPQRKARPFVVPHLSLNTSIMAADVAGVRAFGSETQVETIAQLVNDRLMEMRESLEVTHEYHRIGAIQGNVLDADGSTSLYNFFTEFGVTETEVEFDFSDATTDIKLLALSVIRSMEDALGATPYTRIRAFCGNSFFDELISHTSVKTAYDRYQEGSFLRTQQNEKGFDFGGIVWENYRGSIGSINFIPTTECRFVPEGVPGLFSEISAPADFIEAVNTPGKPIYAKQERMKFDMGIELHSQSNVLMMCARPQCLIKGTEAAGSASASASASGS